MTAPSGVTPHRAATYRTALLVISTAALIAVDLVHFTIATGIGALALAAFVIVYLTKLHASRAGVYGFLIAEVSPISLQADLVTALIYQACCLLFLTAAIVPFPHVATLRTYARPALVTLLIAAVSLALGWALFSTNSLTALQAASLAGTIVLVVSMALLYVRRDPTPLQRAPEA